jgi:hypothetical protein
MKLTTTQTKNATVESVRNNPVPLESPNIISYLSIRKLSFADSYIYIKVLVLSVSHVA